MRSFDVIPVAVVCRINYLLDHHIELVPVDIAVTVCIELLEEDSSDVDVEIEIRSSHHFRCRDQPVVVLVK